MREGRVTESAGDLPWIHPASRGDRWRALAYLTAAAILAATLLLAIVVGRVAATGVLLVAFLSFILAYLVAPAAEGIRTASARLRRGRPLSRTAATLVIYTAVGMVVVPVWQIEGPRLGAALGRMRSVVPAETARFIRQLRATERWYESAGLPLTLNAPIGVATRTLTRSIEEEARRVGAELAHVRGLVPWLPLVPVVSFLLLTRWRGFRRSTTRVLPTPHLRWRGDELLRHLNRLLASYTRAQALSALVVGAACWIGFAALRFEYPGTLALAAGLLEMIPLAGPLIVAVVATAVAPGSVLAPLAFLGALRVVQDYLVYPRLIGRTLHLRPVAVVLALWVGATLGGLVGVCLAIPMLGAVQVARRHWREYREIEQLVAAAETPASPVPAER